MRGQACPFGVGAARSRNIDVMHWPARALGYSLALFWAVPALADPCEGKLPMPGSRFEGVVRYVGDGDGLCIGPAARPDQWIEIRLGDFYAPELNAPGGAEAKRRLTALAMGRRLVCRAGRRSYDRVVGHCSLDGVPLGRRLRAGGGREGGRGYR